MLSVIWVIMVACAVFCGAAGGRLGDVSSAALSGATQAVELCFSMLGPICLWSGLMELMKECGAVSLVKTVLSPLLKPLFRRCSVQTREKISMNVAANVLGLGNAATPYGMAAAEDLGKECKNGRATNELCRLTVINTASVQLIPATVAAVRAAGGSESPFDILPGVWISSLAALAVGLGVAFVFERVGKHV